MGGAHPHLPAHVIAPSAPRISEAARTRYRSVSAGPRAIAGSPSQYQAARRVLACLVLGIA
eukprot:2923661-Rhodomonas_salina.1